MEIQVGIKLVNRHAGSGLTGLIERIGPDGITVYVQQQRRSVVVEPGAFDRCWMPEEEHLEAERDRLLLIEEQKQKWDQYMKGRETISRLLMWFFGITEDDVEDAKNFRLEDLAKLRRMEYDECCAEYVCDMHEYSEKYGCQRSKKRRKKR